jgi:hypothetical protein
MPTPTHRSNAPTVAKPGIVALDIPDRDAILRVLEDCPDELLELRATLLQEHVWAQTRRPRLED